MTQWRLLLEEFHLNVKHIAGTNDDDAADFSSRNQIKHVHFDVVEWETLSKLPAYCDEVAKDPYMLLMQVMSQNKFKDKG